MSATLRPIPVRRLLEHMARELEMSSAVFSVSPGFRGGGRGAAPGPELPLGVAAGANTRMAQNLVAAYGAGARFFELETVGDGPLTLDERLGEYIKAAAASQLLCHELGLGRPDGRVYAVRLPAEVETLAGEELTAFLDAMADASATPLWQECALAARESVRRFKDLDRGDVDALDPHISTTAILSWPGGPAAMEAAARYLLEERRMDVYIDLDPTALGPIGLGACLAAQGGEDCPLDAAAFGPSLADLAEAVDRLREQAAALGLTFGLRLGGTLPLTGGGAVRGAAMAPATLLLCARAAGRWPGMPMLWAGQADYFNLAELCSVGFTAVNVADTLRDPGGYARLRQLSRVAANAAAPAFPDARGAEDLSRAWSRRERYRIDRPEPVRRRLPGKAPLTDCFTDPCRGGCPFGEDIAGALRLMSDGRYRDALRIIVDKNPLPHLTGAICPQPCQKSCTRTFCDGAIRSPSAEALCAEQAWDDLLPRLDAEPPRDGLRVAVVGGSAAGMAVSALLARRGAAVTLLEGAGELCPALRRGDGEVAACVEKDGRLLEALRVDLRFHATAAEPAALLDQGYTHVVLAPEPERGATGQLRMPGLDARADADQGERVFTLPPRSDAEGGVARSIADAHALVDGLLGEKPAAPHPAGRRGGAMGKKGKLYAPGESVEECERCLECATVCECCVDVCPNRANVAVTVLTRSTPQILHLDALCDHCGVCARVCPYESDPGRDKFTLYETPEDFDRDGNSGFVVLDFLARKVRLRLAGAVCDLSLKDAAPGVPAQIRELMETVFIDYPYLLDADRRRETDQVSLF